MYNKIIISCGGIKMSAGLKSIDHKATIKAMKEYLSEYQDWKLRSMRKLPTIPSPKIDGLPKSKSRTPDQQFISHSDAQHEVFKRLDCINKLRNQEPQLGNILYYRFIEKKTVIYLAVKMNISERTLNRYQNTALIKCAFLCEDNMLILKETSSC